MGKESPTSYSTPVLHIHTYILLYSLYTYICSALACISGRVVNVPSLQLRTSFIIAMSHLFDFVALSTAFLSVSSFPLAHPKPETLIVCLLVIVSLMFG